VIPKPEKGRKRYTNDGEVRRLLPPGRDAGPSQGYPPSSMSPVPILYTWVERDNVGQSIWSKETTRWQKGYEICMLPASNIIQQGGQTRSTSLIQAVERCCIKMFWPPRSTSNLLGRGLTVTGIFGVELEVNVGLKLAKATISSLLITNLF